MWLPLTLSEVTLHTTKEGLTHFVFMPPCMLMQLLQQRTAKSGMYWLTSDDREYRIKPVFEISVVPAVLSINEKSGVSVFDKIWKT